jgi:hypothetical protein
METAKFVYWQDGNMWLGYLEEYPDYMTQGESLEEPVVPFHVFVKLPNWKLHEAKRSDTETGGVELRFYQTWGKPRLVSESKNKSLSTCSTT